MAKPSVFIGSSHESLAVVDAIAKGLREVAQVFPWNKPKLFGAGEFILSSLLQQAQKFDFAIMVFGPDDVLLKGKQKIVAPRDNVVFELGLFMSQIEERRALALVPRIPNGGIKILSDLGGLKTLDYEPPETKEERELNWVLRQPLQEIRQRIRELGARPEPLAVVRQGPKDVATVGSEINRLFETAWEEGRIATVRNIALDMGGTWGLINGLLSKPKVHDFDWQTLMIDPDSSAIREVAGTTVSITVAAGRIEQIRKTCSRMEEPLKTRNVGFACKKYDAVPVLHGFLVNNSALFMTMTRMENGELIGDPNHYLTFEARPGGESIDYAFTAFSNWFDHFWAKGSDIWPVNAKSNLKRR